MKTYNKKQLALPALSLFTSLGTLMCCAMPALFVSLGAGAVLAGLVTNYPGIAIISRYKPYVFSISAMLLLISGMMLYRARNLPCPADPKKADACRKMRKISLWIYGFSVLIFLTGFFFAFIAEYVLI